MYWRTVLRKQRSTSKQMEQLCLYISDMCACSSHGGRVLKVTPTRCVVQDICSWTEDMSQCVRNRFPSAEISVCQNFSSVTGFNVIVQLTPPSYTHMGPMAMFGLLFMCMCMCSYWMFTRL